MMDYILFRSRRKTLALSIREGSVVVRAPQNLPKSEIDRFVASKHDWISGNLAISREQLERRSSFKLCYGGAVRCRGKEYPIVAMPDVRAGFDGTAFCVPPDLAPEAVKAACIRIYRTLAMRHMTSRAMEYAARMNVTPSAIKINGAKTHWASCSARGSLNFSWRLIMADDDVIDYVVVHELAHLAEMNHSARFWAIVEGLLPDCHERRRRLREFQARLAGEDWEG